MGLRGLEDHLDRVSPSATEIRSPKISYDVQQRFCALALIGRLKQ